MTFTSWFSFLATIVVALAVVLVPGLIATSFARLSLVARVSLSGVMSVALIGIGGVVAAMVRVPFTPAIPLALASVTGLVGWVLRTRRRTNAPSPDSFAVSPWTFVSWLLSASAVVIVTYLLVPDPDRISQTYDNVFHLAAIAHILDSGDASSFTLRTLIEPTQIWSFYPAGWHSIVALTAQLSGTSVALAVNAAWVAVVIGVWLPGSAWLSQTLLTKVAPNLAAIVAFPLAASFAAMPYTLLTWGSLYPTLLATAILPSAISTAASVRRVPDSGGRRARLSLSAAATAAVAALVAIAFSQPRVLVTWAVLIGPLILTNLFAWYRASRLKGGRAARIALVSLAASILTVLAMAVASFTYLVLRLDLFNRPLEDRLNGPQARATQSVSEGLLQVLAQAWPTGVGTAPIFPSLILAAFVVVGIVVAVRTPGTRWMVVSYSVLAVLFALAAGSDDTITKLLTGLWYKDRYRLSSALPVFGVVLATLGIWSVARLLGRRRSVALWSTALAAATASSSVVAMAAGGLSADVAFVFRLPERAAESEVVSAAQIAFGRDVEAIVPVDQRILGDPWDGSALSLLFANREPVFPHVNGQWDVDRSVVATRLDQIATDPSVCAALNTLEVRYVLYHPHEFGGGDPSGNKFAAVHRAVQMGLFTEVLTDGDSTLYRVDQCGALG